jgi:hypothetical protein
MLECKYTMESGLGKKLFVLDDRLMIRIYGFFSKKLKSTMTIQYSSIISIDYKNSGSIFSGYMDFITPDIEKKNESWSPFDFLNFFDNGIFLDNEKEKNRFEFSGQNELAKEIKNYIEERVVASQKC